MSESPEDYDTRVLGVLKTLGTSTANYIASKTKRKQETARKSLDRLAEKGLVYSTKSGKRTYFTLMPNGKTDRIRLAKKKMEKKTEVYAHPSLKLPIHRASTRLELIPEQGFVCHPSIKGFEVGRDYIRCHFNGEYQLKIAKKGDMKSVDYLANTDTRIWWEKNGLSTNVACTCEIRIPNDPVPFMMRTVSCKDGTFKTASFWIHPRYIYYVKAEKVSETEFEQQVKDIVKILEQTGWKFEMPDVIPRKGQAHIGFNDPVLGGIVGDYNHRSDDVLHFDHSHGVNECEFYGNEGQPFLPKPYESEEVTEIMVQLPNIVKMVINTMKDVQNQFATMLDIQMKQFTFLNNKMEGNVTPLPFENNGMFR